MGWKDTNKSEKKYCKKQYKQKGDKVCPAKSAWNATMKFVRCPGLQTIRLQTTDDRGQTDDCRRK